MERIKRVVITWEDENWEYELELTGAEAEHFTESEAAAYAAQDAAENETTMKRLLDIDIETEELDDREAVMEEAAYWNEFFWMRERSINRSQAFHSAPRAERLLCWCMTRRICWISVSGTPNALQCLSAAAVGTNRGLGICPGKGRGFCVSVPAQWTNPPCRCWLFGIHENTPFHAVLPNRKAASPSRFRVRNILAVASSSPTSPSRISQVRMANFGFSVC